MNKKIPLTKKDNNQGTEMRRTETHKIDSDKPSSDTLPVNEQLPNHLTLVNINNRLAHANAEAAELMVELEEKNLTLSELNNRLAVSNAESANLMAELEDKNQELKESNRALADANAHAAELMAVIELKDEEIQSLNHALSQANARSAELVAERELSLEEMKRLNHELNTEIAERKKAEEEREAVISKLTVALAKVKTLSGMLPICASCKKIRDDQGYWKQVEEYIHDHSEAVFSHSVCPDCLARLYPEYNKRRMTQSKIFETEGACDSHNK